MSQWIRHLFERCGVRRFYPFGHYASLQVVAALLIACGTQVHAFDKSDPAEPAATCGTADCAALAQAAADQAHRFYVNGLPNVAQIYLSGAQGKSLHDDRLVYEQALVDDALGHFDAARRGYDRLQGTALQSTAAIPSAVNWALLQRYDAATSAFDAVHAGSDAYLAAYLTLWKSWLLVRSGKVGDAGELRAQLAAMAGRVRGASPYQQALLDLYANKASITDVLSAINAMPPHSQQQRDARTEAIFFAGSYLQYVVHDRKAALQLYQNELPRTGASVEQPVIEQQLMTLMPVFLSP